MMINQRRLLHIFRTARFGVGIMVFLSLALLSSQGMASHVEGEEAGPLTTKLLLLAEQLKNVPASEQAAVVDQITEIALERNDVLAGQIESDPEAFLLHALPEAALNQLPDGIQELLEQHIEVSGEVTVFIADDFDNEETKLTYTLDSAEEPGEAYNLHFAKTPPSWFTGTMVTVRGVALGRELVLEQSSDEDVDAPPAAELEAGGAQNTIVILFNFTNKTTQPWTTGAVDDVIFNAANSVNQYFQDTSFNQISFTGDVVGWYTIPYTDSPCSYNTWASAANSAATDDGVVLANYSRRVYMFPTTSSCSWAGLGTLGGNPSKTWSDGYNDRRLLAHELGHNVGVHHASSLSCGGLAVDNYANCSTSEYGDVYDTMGSWNYYQFNPPHKVAMGWIPAANVETVTTDGIYSVEPSEVATAGIQALKISKPDTSEHYYIGFRQPIGFDAGLPSGIISGADVHIWNGNAFTQTKLVDTHPGTATKSDASLADDDSFSDLTNGITVTQLSHDASSAVVEVSMGVIECSPSAPSVGVSPPSQSGSDGQTLNYTVTVDNNDSIACGDSTFALTSDLPLGWAAASFSPSFLMIAAGGNSNSTWSVTSPVDEFNGSYPITVWATDVLDATHQGNGAATYVIFADNTPPAVSITDPVEGDVVPNNTNIIVSAADDGAVDKVEIYIDGKLKVTDTSDPYTYSWKTKKEAPGDHTITATAYDQAGNDASDTINVVVSGGGGGDGGKKDCPGNSCK